MKILFYINSASSYQFDFYKILKKRKINFHVIFEDKQIENFNWKFAKNNWSTFLNKKNKKNHFMNLIRQIDPNIVILGGYKLKFQSILKKFPYIKKIYWLERVNEENLLKKFIRRKILSKILNDAHAILAIGEKAKKFYLKFNKKVFNFPYSLSPINRNYVKKRNKSVNFLFVGQLIERKGLSKLLNVLRNNDFGNSEFTFVGDGPLEKNIKKLILYRKNVKFYNFVDRIKLNNIYNKNDVLILLSNFDGWGVVIIEAMSKKLGIISNQNVGASLEFIKNKYNGIIVDNQDQSIVNAIRYCIQNKNTIKKWGIINKKIYKKSLSNSINASKKFEKIIKNLS